MSSSSRKAGAPSRLGALTAVLLCLAAVFAPPAAALPRYPDVDRFTWFGNYRIDQVWRTGATGQGITVAVLDTGVDPGRELRGVVLPGTDFSGGDGRRDTDRPRGHGTAMARFVAAQGGGPNGLTGIAPNARILPVVVDPYQRGATAASYTQGIEWAVSHGAKVINISQGTTGDCPPSVEAAIAYAIRAGAIVVVAAGNTGDTDNATEFPASCEGMLTVGSVYGDKRPWPKSQRKGYVDVAAPGVDMADENLAGEAGKSSGTSNSATLVSASAALVWSKFPTLTNRQVVARLLATVADDSARPGRDDVTGYGIVLPYKAITTNVPATAPNPIFDGFPESSPGASVPPLTTDGPTFVARPPAASGSGSSSLPLFLGVAAGLVVIGGGVLAVVLRSRRRRPPPTKGW